MRRQIDGTKVFFKIHNHRSALLTFSFFPQIATVEFLKEIKLTDPFRDVRLLSRDRLKPFPLDEECESQQMSETERYCEIAFWLHFSPKLAPFFLHPIINYVFCFPNSPF